jgi:hypothetical protein
MWQPAGLKHGRLGVQAFGDSEAASQAATVRIVGGGHAFNIRHPTDVSRCKFQQYLYCKDSTNHR